MKATYTVLSLVTLIYLTGCHSQKSLVSHGLNAESIDPRGNTMLLGKSTRERLQQEPFGSWFNKNYSEYKVDSNKADLLRPNIQNKRFVIFMGTWCGDSRLEVPRIYKLLDYCGVSGTAIQLINLNVYDSVYKQSPTHEERGLNIHRVPDLLVYENGKEIGRIIERPVKSWEEDLLTILRHGKYEANYKIVSYLDSLFRTVTSEKIEKDIVKIADSLSLQITKNEGLQSFGNVLLATNQIPKALLVHRLNTMLYPTNSSGFVALGDVYLKTGERLKAKESYERALVIEPGHNKAILMLAQLMK